MGDVAVEDLVPRKIINLVCSWLYTTHYAILICKNGKFIHCQCYVLILPEKYSYLCVGL